MEDGFLNSKDQSVQTIKTSSIQVDFVSTHTDHSTKKRNHTYARFSKPREIGDAKTRAR